MSLKARELPTFTAVLPSNKTVITFKPFRVKDEKILLIASEGGDPKDMARAMEEVVSSCIVSPDLSISSIPYFDLEYLFMKIRSKSVSETAVLSYRHVDGVNRSGEKCDAVTDVQIDLNKVEIEVGQSNNVIELDTGYGVKLKYPSVKSVNEIASMPSEVLAESRVSVFLAACIESVYDGEDVQVSDGIEDGIKFIDSLTRPQFDKLSVFINDIPTLKHSVRYKCKGCGQEDVATLQGVRDFF